MADNERANMAFMGYFLIGMFLLVFAVLGLQDAGLFGDAFNADGEVITHTLPLSWIMVATFAAVVAVALALYSVFVYRTGNKSATAIFIVFSASLFAYAFLSVGRELFKQFAGTSGVFVSSSWFIFVIFAIMFVVISIYLYLDKAPKFLALLALAIGVMFVFLGLAYYHAFAADANTDIVKAMSVVFGIFAFLGFFLSTYIGLVYSVPKAKLPLV